MMIRTIFTFLVVFASVFTFAQTTTQNYTVETIYKNGRNPLGIYRPNAGDFVTATYYDGVGRPIQQIQKNASPVSNQNIVTHFEYEKNIGQTKQYLPYTTAGANVNFVPDAQQQTMDFYTTYNEYTQNPFSENRLEASPNARVLETGAPGTDWAINTTIPENTRHTIRYVYDFNKVNEVKKFDVSSNWNASRAIFTNTLSENGFYPANSLKKTITKNENWKTADGKNNTIEEFKGTDGKILLKRTYNNSEAHDTYYVYDFYGNLAYVLPPLANGTVSTNNLNNLCYQYLYDEKNRLVEKKQPQKQWEYIVYDKADRIVMTGPVNNPFDATAVPGWILTKYDNQNRTVYTGFYNGHTVTSANRKAIKDLVYLQADVNETKQTSDAIIDGVTVRYSNTKFPTTFHLLTVNYYDNYHFAHAPTSFAAVQGVTPTQMVKGLATGSWTRVLTNVNERKATLSYTLYNNKYQPIRTYTTNYLGGFIQTDNELTFRGIPTKTITTHKKDDATAALTITNNYTYDHRERLTKQTQQIGSGVVETIAENSYDELGVLVTKNVGGTTGNLQKVAYKYNIRGWLTNINNADRYAYEDEIKLFNLKLNYERTDQISEKKPLYNGNINSVLWRTKSDNFNRGYLYNYDYLNRLTNAQSMFYHTGWTMAFVANDSYNEALTYDKNGNILTLNRTGEFIDDQPIEWDDLTYTYTANQLQSVTDATNNADGFNDGNTVGVDYTYDAFGNLKTDKNKKITNINYNHLNLPTEITFATGKITYTYDATGNKLKKVVQPTSGVAQTTDYLYGFQYLNGTLQFFPHAEGYVKPNGTNSYLYVYQYKDHLGNVRLSYADCDGNGTINPATEILEENNYYPFGLQHQGYNDIANSCRNEEAEQIKYNGKEYEDNFGLNMYEYGARNYDPAVGRFFNIDNYAEKFSDMTPYQYAGNNPVYFIDVNGEYVYIWDNGERYKFDAGKLFVLSDKEWVEHTPEAGSFLETTFNALKKMYEFSDDTSGGNGGGGSFGKRFLNMFNNDINNLDIRNSLDLDSSDEYFGTTQSISKRYKDGSLKSEIYLNLKDNFKSALEFKSFDRSLDIMFVIGHELGHSLSFMHSVSIRQNTWFELPQGPVTVDEIFGTFIENQLRDEHKQPLRMNYLNWGDPSINKGWIIPFNNQVPGVDINSIINEYKKSIPLKW